MYYSVISDGAFPPVMPRSLDVFPIDVTKEAALERADFTLQLLMFVTEKKEKRIFFLTNLCQWLSTRF